MPYLSYNEYLYFLNLNTKQRPLRRVLLLKTEDEYIQMHWDTQRPLTHTVF